MSVVDYTKKKGLLGKVMDLAKLSIDSTLVNMEKSLYVASNTFDAVLAIQGKVAAELTGQTVSLQQVMDTDTNIWCPDGKFVPSELQEEEEESSSSSEEGEKPLTKQELLEIVKENNKAQEERFLALLETLKNIQ